MSNDSLNKAMEHPVNFDIGQTTVPLREGGPTSTEVTVRPRNRRRERRFSAPPSDRRIRDSVGSLDYSEGQGECVRVWSRVCVRVWSRVCVSCEGVEQGVCEGVRVWSRVSV